MATFQQRLKQRIGNRGYESCMRRSIQTVLLYEAYRCVAEKMNLMRPFQRKLAFFDQMTALVQETGFLPHQQDEILWRTATSKEPMIAETAWKRFKLIEKEIEKLQEKIKPLCVQGRDHDDIVSEFVQQQYEAVTGTKDKPYPSKWEHSHNNVIMAYRMYYKGGELDPTFPQPQPPKAIIVPAAKPPSLKGEVGGNSATGENSFYLTVPHEQNVGVFAGNKEDTLDLTGAEPAEDRQQVLHEIKTHLDLLKEFEGIVPDDVLNKRKRELFAALPSAPPPVAVRSKRRRDELLSNPKRPRLNEPSCLDIQV